MAKVDVDDSCQFSADSQPKSIGLVCGLAATRRSVYIHQMNRVNSRNDFGHDDSTINIVMAIIMYTMRLFTFRFANSSSVIQFSSYAVNKRLYLQRIGLKHGLHEHAEKTF